MWCSIFRTKTFEVNLPFYFASKLSAIFFAVLSFSLAVSRQTVDSISCIKAEGSPWDDAQTTSMCRSKGTYIYGV